MLQPSPRIDSATWPQSFLRQRSLRFASSRSRRARYWRVLERPVQCCRKERDGNGCLPDQIIRSFRLIQVRFRRIQGLLDADGRCRNRSSALTIRAIDLFAGGDGTTIETTLGSPCGPDQGHPTVFKASCTRSVHIALSQLLHNSGNLRGRLALGEDEKVLNLLASRP